MLCLLLHPTLQRHRVNQTSAVSVEQLDTCILLPAFSRVNILSFTSVIAVTTTLVDSRQYLTISLGLSTLSVQFTFKTVWRQYFNRCTHTEVKHMTRVTWSHSARFGRFRMNQSSVSRQTGVTIYRGNQKQTTATIAGCGNMRLPHWPLPDESTVFRPEYD